MSRIDRPRRACRSHSTSSQPAVSTLQRQAQARDRVRASARTQPSSLSTPSQPTTIPTVDVAENVNCPLCPTFVADDAQALCCDMCVTWYHAECLLLSAEEYARLQDSTESWFCDHCRSIRANKIDWGSLEGEEVILSKVKGAYKEIIKWKKNIFVLPCGKSGTDFLKELT